MRILAIDFETANQASESACSIGYCLWDNGEIIRSDEILIRPHRRFSYFNYFNIQIHGITPEMVKDADDWPAVYGQIAHMFIDSVVIAHNARFDIAVLRAINRLYGIEMNDFIFLDTVTISRIMHPFLPNHKLNTVCDYLNVDLNHHHAGSDALGCLAIMMDTMDAYGEYDVENIMELLHYHGHHYNYLH